MIHHCHPPADHWWRHVHVGDIWTCPVMVDMGYGLSKKIPPEGIISGPGRYSVSGMADMYPWSVVCDRTMEYQQTTDFAGVVPFREKWVETKPGNRAS